MHLSSIHRRIRGRWVALCAVVLISPGIYAAAGQDLRLAQTPMTAMLLSLGILLAIIATVCMLRLRSLSQQRRQLRSQVLSCNRELEASTEELRRQSVSDPLTSLYNRRWLVEAVRMEVGRLRRAAGEQWLGLLLIHLDDFQQINARYGHDGGDAILQQVASRIRLAMRQTDAAARFGGAAFAVILPYTDNQGAVEAARKIRAIMARDPFEPSSGERCVITVSIGIANLHKMHIDRVDQRLFEVLLGNAERALQEARERGGDRIRQAPASVMR